MRKLFVYQDINRLVKLNLNVVVFDFSSQGHEWHHLRSKLTLHLTSTLLGINLREKVDHFQK